MTLYDWCITNNRIDLLDQWHPTKNGMSTPKNVSAHNGNKFWWILAYDDPDTGKHFDFEWESTVAHRVEGLGCPYLYGRYAWPGYNDLKTLRPEIAKEWHPTKNGQITPQDVTVGSGKKVWWYLPYDDPKTGKHFDFEWEAMVRDRCGRDYKCPFISGKAVYKGFNDLASCYPEIAKEWHPTKNGKLRADQVTVGSSKKVWWYLPYDDPKTGKHFDLEWEATIVGRCNGIGCPYLSIPTKKILSGFNDLATVSPIVASEWNYEKNGDLTPEMFSVSSNQSVWWIGKCGHEWKTAISNRTSGKGCPFCVKGGKRLSRFNDFETWCTNNQREELLSEWDYEKNDRLLSEVKASSKYKANWKCSVCGHEWSAVMSSRKKGIGCPECGKKKLSVSLSTPDKDNNLEAFCKKEHLKELLEEWNYDKNTRLPSEVSRASSKYKIWWRCTNCGHEWQSTPNTRIRITEGGKYIKSTCPHCIKARQTSFPEQAIYYYIKQIFPDAISNDRKALGRKELDIYIPSRKTAIEYDGYAWHKNSKKDDAKNQLCHEKGIELIRIREMGCPDNEDDLVQYIYIMPNNYTLLSLIIPDLIKMIEPEYDDHLTVQVEKDRDKIIELYRCDKRELSIATLFPKLVKEWHPTKNGRLKPELFTSGSKEPIWWLCSECGYEWQSPINFRTRASRVNSKCPICAKRIMVSGINDFKTWCLKNGQEHLLDEWVYEKNKENPSEMPVSSPVKVWWKCPTCDSLYKSSIGQRTGKGKCGCPYCGGMAVNPGVNDFETWCKKNGRMELMEQWDYERNDKAPSEYSHGSGKAVWWKCPTCKQSWQAKIDNRKKGRGCPICAGKKICTGINDFETWCKEHDREDLLKEWDKEKNFLLPSNCLSGHQSAVWWNCSKCGNNWEMSPYARRVGRGCPKCAGRGRRFVNVETGKEFSSIADARKYYQIPNAHIGDCLHGARPKAGGFHWQYIDE